MDTDPQQKYLWKSAIKERGWTDGAIARFLGEPDQFKPNPYSRKAAPMQFWLESKVLEAEQSEVFQQWFESSKGKRKQASDRMTAKMEVERNKTIDFFSEEIRASVQEGLAAYTSIERLERDAVEHWAEHQQAWLASRGKYEFVEPPKLEEVDRLTIGRWVDNYVRHQLTNYEYLLAQSKGAIGREIAYETMKAIVSTAVGEFYRSCKQSKEC